MDEPLWTLDSLLPWLFAYAMAIGLLVPPIYSYRRARRARGWPKVRGKVLRISSECDDGATSIDIEYEYQAHGALLRGRRIRFGGGPYYRQKTVRTMMDRFPKDSYVEVRYDPDKPSLSVLDTTFEWLSWLPFFLLAIAIIAPWTWKLLSR